MTTGAALHERYEPLGASVSLVLSARRKQYWQYSAKREVRRDQARPLGYCSAGRHRPTLRAPLLLAIFKAEQSKPASIYPQFNHVFSILHAVFKGPAR